MPVNQRLVVMGITLTIAVLMLLGVAAAAPGGTVILDPPVATKSGLPGATITHSLHITNAGGTTTDAFTLTLAGNVWPVSLPVSQAQLSPNAGATFNVIVTIPLTPTTTSDTVTVAVYRQGSTQVLTSQLTTQIARIYLPVILKMIPDVCRPTGEIYDALPIYDWEPAQRPAKDHADLNLALRDYTPINAFPELVDIGGAWDPAPPQLAGVFSPPRAPDIKTTYQVYGWDWGCNCRIGPISPPEDPEVTLIDLAATPGETVHVPDRLGGEIAPGYKAMVLYADATRLTLKYTAEDNVIVGFTVHIENICVDSNLLALYQQLNGADRHELPALHGGQAVGRARINRVGVVIRDTGTFMDPRSRKDWWHGY